MHPIQEIGNDGKGFKPIGFDSENSFIGGYDGSHHLITELLLIDRISMLDFLVMLEGNLRVSSV